MPDGGGDIRFGDPIVEKVGRFCSAGEPMSMAELGVADSGDGRSDGHWNDDEVKTYDDGEDAFALSSRDHHCYSGTEGWPSPWSWVRWASAQTTQTRGHPAHAS